MFNKKGLSEVVSNVLIILVVIGAVALIAGVVINIVQTGTESTASASACISTKFQVISCVQNGANADVVVKRLPGGSNDAVGYRIISNSVGVGPQTAVTGLAQYSTATESLTDAQADDEVNVVAEINGKACQPIFSYVTCA